MTDGTYEVVLARPARRAVQDGLPEAVALAAIEFITGPLVDNPQRVGGQLNGDLKRCRSARLGTYRIVYRNDEVDRTVFVLRVAHRRDAYST